jgi:hypothetical protein
VCPLYGADMRVIAFITDAPTIHDILDDLGQTLTPLGEEWSDNPPRLRAEHIF